MLGNFRGDSHEPVPDWLIFSPEFVYNNLNIFSKDIKNITK